MVLTSLSAVVAGTVPVLADQPAAHASQIETLQAKARVLGSQIDSLNVRLGILDEEYVQAQSRVASLHRSIGADTAALGVAASSVQRDNKNLRFQAVDAYVNSGSEPGLSAVLSSSANELPAQQTYLRAASGSLTTAVASLANSEHALSVRRSTLETAKTQADSAANTLAVSRAAAANLELRLTGALHQVKGRVSALVAAEEAAQQLAAQRAAEAAAQAAQAQLASDNSGSAPPPVAVTSSDARGSSAVSSAETQLGVPYRWAGASPGSGFDCSGLAMWAWGRAGVALPHSAAAQYDSIEHVSLSALQPGDLIFYASGGYIYHVIMYIGGGRAIQAIDTGTVISVTPVWPGAIGAGRP